MAVPGVEVEIITGGTEGRPAELGRWVQNLWRPKGSEDWQTRPGFGQQTQIDTSMRAGTNTEWGVKRHLGSHIVQTAWGAEQLVSVFLMTAQTGTSDNNQASRWGRYYTVAVTDLATREIFEQVLFRHTSENKSSEFGKYNTPRMRDWYGNYSTNETYDNQEFLFGIEESFYFTVYQNKLFMGNRYTGMLCYQPSDFRGRRDRTVESDQEVHWSKGYSEDCIVTRVVPVDGLASAKFNYVQEKDFPAPVAVSTLQNRFVVAAEDRLLFSDVNVPNSFIDLNSVLVPTQEKVRAIAEIGSNLLVFTEREMMVYQPSVAALASDGRFTVISRSIGCLSPRAITSVGSTVFWADTNGVYSTSNGFEINELSKPINQFFKGGMTSPLNNYLTNTGASSPTTDVQPRTLYRQSDLEDVTIAFNQENAVLLAAFPGSNCVWCFSAGEWSLWPVESTVKEVSGAAVVGVQRNIEDPHILSGKKGIFLVGSVDEQTFTSVTTTGNARHSSSFYVMELGRGGAMDRSISSEDYRLVIGENSLAKVAAAGVGRAYFGRPTFDAVTGEHWIPIEIVPDYSVASLPTRVEFTFDFDNTKWAAGATLVIPPERAFALGGFGVLTYTVVGSTITIVYSAGPQLNMAKRQRNPFVSLRLTPVSASDTLLDYGINFGLPGSLAQLTDAALNVTDLRVYVWNQHYGPLHADDDVAQPVDWAYKSLQIGIDSSSQVRSRGLFTRMISHGSAAAPQSPNWLWGVFNTLLGADWKGWSSQVIDFSSGLVKVEDKFTLRTRYTKSGTTSLASRIFNDDPVYGEFLIDDEEHDMISTSDAVRGAYLTYMMFGFIRDRAEGVVLASSKAVIRKGGSRRRTGR